MAGRKVILTHNNADLDALASLYAMYKLTPDAEPILPRRVHRNVDKFLLLYGRALPGFNQENLQKEDVELAYVVDSQSFDMVRGMHPTTPIYIIDHHPLEQNLPEHYQFQGKPTGANTTLLVEMIIERGIYLSSLEATLLMCGIYEDTGSLTYSATTVEDIQAAAWLLQHGADLDIVRDFLRHWMDDSQKELLSRLQENAETTVYQGHSVMITSAVLKEPMEDLSTVASELRDLFETSAMFMVLQIKKNVQMIARSVVDDIHVGRIMQHFEGGGHNRAAAALVRDTPLDDVLRELRQVLQNEIRPAVRVADMMSLGVQVIRDDSTIREAENLMLHSGHEGYPVLDKNRHLVGLVTRRAVERAMHHDMQHRPVSDIMDAGTVMLRPEDSIELLKDKILDSGWGQIPVVDEENQVIGIITRTDLISHWGQKLPYRNGGEMVHRLKAALPEGVWRLLQVIADHANDLNYRVFLVGGIVRDLLLGTPNLDIDLVVEGEAIRLTRRLQKQFGGGIQQHDQFGTAKWKIDAAVAETLGYSWDEASWPQYVDFATSRAEFYDAPTALPTVRPSSIKMDLHRRDFTINTLAIRLAPPPMGELLDFYKGVEDLEKGIIRALHSLSFIDDPTRMLRAVRFEQRFGFRIEERTEQLIANALPLIERLSGDRIRHEINMILAEKTALKGLERLQELGILQAVHPALHVDDPFRSYYEVIQKVRQNPPWPLPEDFDSWHTLIFAILTRELDEETLESVSKRLMVSRLTREKLRVIHRGYQVLTYLHEMPPSEITYTLEPLTHVGWLACWILTHDAQTRQKIEQFVNHWRHIKPSIDGNILLKMGVKASPFMGKLLHDLRARWLDGEITNAEDEQRYIEQCLREDHP